MVYIPLSLNAARSYAGYSRGFNDATTSFSAPGFSYIGKRNGLLSTRSFCSYLGVNNWIIMASRSYCK